MVKNMSITQVRGKLTSIHKDIQNDTIAITNRGEPVLALMNWDLYSSILETIEILSDPDLVGELQKSIEEVKQGMTVSLKDAVEGDVF